MWHIKCLGLVYEAGPGAGTKRVSFDDILVGKGDLTAGIPQITANQYGEISVARELHKYLHSAWNQTKPFYVHS